MFWKTQPVGTKIELRREDAPTPLPDEHFEWGTCTVVALRNLLAAHYLSDGVSRLDYTVDLLTRELCDDDHFNVALRHKGKLVGFIGATPRSLNVRGESVRVVHVNFLCLARKYRSKAFAPLLIREITRRAVARGIQQAVYTAAAELPGVVARGMHWHRIINPQKLVERGFYTTDQPKNRYHDVRGSSSMRPMEEKDVSRVVAMLRENDRRFDVYMDDIDEEYVRAKVMSTHAFVTEEGDSEPGFACLYELNNVAPDGKNTIRQLFARHVVGRKTLGSLDVFAQNLGYDIVTVCDFGFDNETLRKNRFLLGTQSLVHLYLYNLETPDPALAREKISLVII